MTPVYLVNMNGLYVRLTLCEDHAELLRNQGYSVEAMGLFQHDCEDCRNESEYADLLRLYDSYDRLGETPRSY